MSCQCYQIGGPFIAEDPDCPAHGREAQRVNEQREVIIDQLDRALRSDIPEKIEQAAFVALEFLRSL